MQVGVLGAALASVLVAFGASVAHANLTTYGTGTISIQWFDLKLCPTLPTCALQYSYTETDQLTAQAQTGPALVGLSPTGNTYERNPFFFQLYAQDGSGMKIFGLKSAVLTIVNVEYPELGNVVLPYWAIQVPAANQFTGVWAYTGPSIDPEGIASNVWADVSCGANLLSLHTAAEWNSGYAPPGWQGNPNTNFTATVGNGQSTIDFASWIGPVCEGGPSQFGPTWQPRSDGYVTAKFTFPGDIRGGLGNPTGGTGTPGTGTGATGLPIPAPIAMITKTTIRALKHTASFNFKANGHATGFQCALVKLPKKGKKGKVPKPNYGACRSPITYKRLTTGKYSFYVRALGADQSPSKPAQRTFKMS
jgi:hypothetical protein